MEGTYDDKDAVYSVLYRAGLQYQRRASTVARTLQMQVVSLARSQSCFYA